VRAAAGPLFAFAAAGLRVGIGLLSAIALVLAALAVVSRRALPAVPRRHP
jgi:hypothetical protein